MRKNIVLLTFLILSLIVISGCQPATDEMKGEQNSPEGDTGITLAGISLGDTINDVEASLGKDYIIECSDEDSGWWGEPVTRIYYGDDMEIIIGDETGQVLQIALNSDRYTTTNGDKVGDEAQKVLPGYQEKYPPAKDHFEGNDLPGWFVVEEEVWLIFNFKDDGTMVNEPIEPREKVESIHLVYEKFMH